MRSLGLTIASFTNKLSYPKKFITLGSITILVIALLMYQLISQATAQIRVDTKELRGMEWMQPAVALLGAVVQYRSLNQQYLNGMPVPKEQLENTKKMVDVALFNLAKKNEQLGTMLESTEFWDIIRIKWENIKNQTYLSGSIDFYTENTVLVNAITNMINLVADSSGISFDLEEDSYYNSEMYFRSLPDYLNQVSKIKDTAVIALYKKSLSQQDENQLELWRFIMDKDLETVQTNIKKIIKYNPKLAGDYKEVNVDLYNATGDLFLTLSDSIMNRSFNVSIEDFSKQTQAVVNEINNLFEISRNNFITLLNARIHKAQINLAINFIVSLAVALFLILFYISIYFSVMVNINKLVFGAKRLVLEGNLTEAVTLDTKDELSQIAKGFNIMQQILRDIITEIESMVSSAVNGDLSRKIDTSNKKGFSKQLGSSLNQLSDTIQSAIGDIVETLNALSKGDLSHKIAKNYKGIFSELKTYVNNTINSLEKLVVDIKSSIKTVNDKAREIAKGNANLAKRTELQTDALQKTAITVVGLTSGVKKNVDNAQTANKLVLKASNVAMEGGIVVNKVIETMALINDSSKKVVNITDMIDQIALQTNILALNAAVEASYAGEQGKGFSVIASEIRKLAEHSAYAAKEIKTLIAATVSRVDDEMQLVDQAGETMNEIVMSVKQVSDIMHAITVASNEQSAAIEQVNHVMLQMEEIAQQNTTLVEQAARAAKALEGQTDHVGQLVDVFKLKDTSMEEKIQG